jgi:hypothetical protein
MYLPLKLLKFISLWSGYVTIITGTGSIIGAIILTSKVNQRVYLSVGDVLFSSNFIRVPNMV